MKCRVCLRDKGHTRGCIRGYIQGLQARIKDLENKLRQVDKAKKKKAGKPRTKKAGVKNSNPKTLWDQFLE